MPATTLTVVAQALAGAVWSPSIIRNCPVEVVWSVKVEDQMLHLLAKLSPTQRRAATHELQNDGKSEPNDTSPAEKLPFATKLGPVVLPTAQLQAQAADVSQLTVTVKLHVAVLPPISNAV